MRAANVAKFIVNWAGDFLAAVAKRESVPVIMPDWTWRQTVSFEHQMGTRLVVILQILPPDATGGPFRAAAGGAEEFLSLQVDEQLGVHQFVG